MEQDIRFCTTPDGVRLAYATVGEGPPLVKVAHWLSHLEYDWDSPVWRHWLNELSGRHRLVRYDERGCGLSDRHVDDLSLEAWVQDLETVIDTLGLERFPLLGTSQGGPVAVTYAVRHPEKVSHLILYGSFAQGWAKFNNAPHVVERMQALLTIIRTGWGQDNPAFRQIFTSWFIPEATTEQKRWFNDLERITMAPETAARCIVEFGNFDVLDLLPQVAVPTLVLHARDDALVPFGAGRQLASTIPDARLVSLESKNHILLEAEPAWPRFLNEVRRFLGVEPEGLTADHWDQLSALFKRALALPPDERDALLDQAHRDNPTLRRELESLLAADAQAGLTEDLDKALKASLVSWSATATIQPGRAISHYTILDKLGAGGMGVVYKARDTDLDRLVALKFLPPQLNAHAEAKQRFVHEAKAASALDHTNICTIYEIGETDDRQCFIAMAFYDGETLKQKIERGPLPLGAILDYTGQVAEGLSRAHEAGIVHRDVKPANVMVTGRGKIKLLDFGIAKMADVDLTKTGSTIGTAAYMSPEQARGLAVDHRSDLWSLGVVLYEMLTGQRPFLGDYQPAIVYEIVHEEPEPVSTLRPEAPETLARIVEKLLRKTPDERYPDAEALLADLRSPEQMPEAVQSPTPSRKPAAAGRSRVWVYGAAALFLIVLALVGRALLTPGQAPIDSIAVLPLANFSGDPEQAYFADGMTEEVIAVLGRIEALRVISRTSMMRYKQTTKSLPEIAQELGVAAVVEGSVEQDGDRVRIDVRLIDGASEERLWEHEFEREMRDVLALRQDVARSIAREIEITLSSEEEARLADAPVVNPEAFDWYLKGVQALHLRDLDAYERAAGYFEQSIAIDASFAPAHARLAFSYALQWDLSPDAMATAREAVETALRLDPSLSEAYVATGLIQQFYDWNWESAEQAFRQAVQVNPGNDEAHHELAQLLMRRGRFEDAIAAENRALFYNPLSALYRSGLGEIYLYYRQYDRAIDEINKALDLEPDRSIAYYWLGRVYLHQARYDDALAAWERTPRGMGWLGEIYAQWGRREEALQRADELMAQLEGEDMYTLWGLSLIYAGLNEKDQALDWLERAYASPSPSAILTYLKVEPTLDPLRSEPRFQALLAKTGLE